MNKHPLSPADAAALKAFVALSRQLGFPRGKDTSDHTKGGQFARPQCTISWHKRGGHAGTNITSKVATAARTLGFERLDTTRHDVPDGSVIGSGTAYVKRGEGGTTYALTVCTSYGALPADNSYSMTLTGPKLNRSE